MRIAYLPSTQKIQSQQTASEEFISVIALHLTLSEIPPPCTQLNMKFSTEPYPNGVYTAPIPGCCYGSAQYCANNSVGYLVFLRSSKKKDEITTDQINLEQYHRDIFLPFVATTRNHYLLREGWTDGDPINDENVWVGWQVRLFVVV